MEVPRISEDLPPGASKLSEQRSLVIATTVIAVVFIVLRLWAHARPAWIIWWDDVLVAASLPVMITLCVTGVLSFEYGSGTRTNYLTVDQFVKATKLQVISTWLWIWTISFLRMSIAFTILRVKNTGWWRVGLYGVILFQLALALANIFWDIGHCKPLESLWDPRITGKPCLTGNMAFRKIATFSSIHVVLDIGLSLIPIIFIRKIHRGRYEKSLLGCLMGLGLITSAFAITKLVVASYAEDAEDTKFEEYKWAIWTWLEMMMTTIAACSPFLKPPVERLLRKWDLISTPDHETAEGIASQVQQAQQQNQQGETGDVEQGRTEPNMAGTATRETEPTEGSETRESWGSGKSRQPLLGRSEGRFPSNEMINEKIEP
ncbi:hypothetical protein P152DRAFT_265336 [Eremomyces bilateralis CBS 781.70]|uniref:Rhodopsin domain-containing protein n=1 Tax=Eremomyces bilateralis CBS 781.70 TaxID=1392243 RepID=A0A6G1G8C7_9PEZI|nr:uncharacterized protein P152DRAFT_265336 [Eremomyces bilateralis CBS 781.70]KAF1814242.1 hypothetical protein P152DRAFT_265336 [Eremomyces bilateralis CBS 781.70]